MVIFRCGKPKTIVPTRRGRIVRQSRRQRARVMMMTVVCACVRRSFRLIDACSRKVRRRRYHRPLVPTTFGLRGIIEDINLNSFPFNLFVSLELFGGCAGLDQLLGPYIITLLRSSIPQCFRWRSPSLTTSTSVDSTRKTVCRSGKSSRCVSISLFVVFLCFDDFVFLTSGCLLGLRLNFRPG